jgi:two-component system cell cycle response regulator DivK
MRLVLLVDDSPDTLEMYAMGLAFAGHRALTASTAESALRQLGQEHPDAVVTDLHFAGGRDGWTLIQDIKREPSTRDIPIVVLTGDMGASVAHRARRAGCAALLTKPCLPDDLVEVLRRMMPHDASRAE